jgi:putative membrane protein
VSQKRRWPEWVYRDGVEPDARFSFANERTFLAWIRTSLAFLAAGVAVDAVPLSIPNGVQRVLAALMVVLGLMAAAASWLRWALAERAMRRGEPLPAAGLGTVMTVGVIAAGIVLLVTLL